LVTQVFDLRSYYGYTIFRILNIGKSWTLTKPKVLF